MFTLRAFGGVCLENDDGPLSGPVAQRRRLGLLALLAASPTRRMSRDKLSAYLWPEADTEHARGMLGDALYALRKDLGKAAIVSSGEELRLDPVRIRTDVGEFRDALAQGDLLRAVELYRGPFLDGFFIPDAPDFERWVDAEREQFARENARALEALADEREAAGDWAGAVQWWLRLAACDASNSRVALRAMQALDAAGDRAGAIRHGSAHQALLQRDLELDADPAVHALAERLRAEPAVRPAPDRRAATGADPPRPVRYEAEPAPASDATLPSPPKRRSGRAAALVAALAGALLLGYLGVRATRGSGGLIGAGTLAEGDAVIVAEFEHQSGDSILASVVSDALRIDLRQSHAVRILASDQVREALVRMKRPNAVLTPELAREVAIRVGVKAVLAGTVGKGGPGYILSARLIAAGSGDELIGLRETAADAAQLIPAIDRLSKRLRGRIGESVRTIRASPPLADVTTSSLEALRAFSRAGRAAFVDGDVDRAVMLLERAVALDTAFGAAHTLLFSVLRMQSVLGGRDQTARRVDALATAYRHRDRLTERERYVIEAAYFTHVSGDVDRAVTTMRAAVDAWPDDPLMVGLLSVYYSWVPDFARSEELLHRALALDPADVPSMAALNNLALLQTHRGKFDEAAATWQRLIRSYPDQHVVHAMGTSYTASARGDYDGAEQLVRDCRDAFPGDRSVQTATGGRLADLAALRGHLAASAQYRREAGREGPKSDQLRNALALARQDLLLRRSAERAVNAIDAALARFPLDSIPLLDRPYLELAWIYAQAGRVDRAKEMLGEFESEVPPELRHVQRPAREPILHPYASGAIALAEGRTGDAIALLRRAGGGCLSCALPMLGVAFERAGQPDSAVAAYVRYLRPEMRPWLSVDAEWLALVHRRLADLLHERGQLEQAEQQYARFLELWKDADAELRPQVREAQQRLGSLLAQRVGEPAR